MGLFLQGLLEVSLKATTEAPHHSASSTSVTSDPVSTPGLAFQGTTQGTLWGAGTGGLWQCQDAHPVAVATGDKGDGDIGHS